jgi:translation initiation factor IF-2
MANIRVYELAKKLGKTNSDILAVLAKSGVRGKTHSSSIEEDTAKKITLLLKKPAPEETEKKKTPALAKPQKPAGKKKAAQRTAARKPAEREKELTGAGVQKPVTEKTEEPPRARAAKPLPVRREKPPKPRPEKREPLRAEAQRPLAPEKKKPPAKPFFTAGQEKKPPAPPAIEEKEAPALPEEEAALKVPDRFRKEIEGEKVEKFKGKPGMQKAFQAIRKIDHTKRFTPGVFKKRGRERPAHHRAEPQAPAATLPRKKTLKIQEGIIVKEFAELLSIKLPELVKKFMELGYTPTINQPVDTDAALLVADTMGIKLEIAHAEGVSVVEEAPEDPSLLKHRPPIVTIMGHVDHGKTSLLDAIRETRVTATEAGGITQHIGAYKVSLKGKEIVFLDTPGHEAFTSLRARGARVTDIVILVVAADDGVKPQTVEAIDHAKAAGVPIIVAINKIDKPEANVQKVKSELAELGIMAEDWGGQNIFAEISAKKRVGIEELLELILLQSEIMELKANPDRMSKGVVIESRLDKGRGPVATLLVQAGTLNIGDVFLSGINTGKVRALYDDLGKKIKSAGPSTPVELVGFGTLPNAGDSLVVMDDEKKARQLAAARAIKLKSAEVTKKRKLTLEDLYSKIKEGGIKELNIVIKGDVQGSVEALKDALEGVKHPEVQVRVIHAGTGGINESDVMLAAASEAVVIGFNVRPEVKAAQTAEREGVDVELYNVIYEAIEDVKKALEGLLEPTIKEKTLGRAEVRQTFFASRLGTIAGCMVVDGTMSRNSDGLRVIRDNIVVYEGRIASLKRFKEDAKEVQSGYECGIMVENFNDIKVGDIIENFILEKITQKL